MITLLPPAHLCRLLTPPPLSLSSELDAAFFFLLLWTTPQLLLVVGGAVSSVAVFLTGDGIVEVNQTWLQSMCARRLVASCLVHTLRGTVRLQLALHRNPSAVTSSSRQYYRVLIIFVAIPASASRTPPSSAAPFVRALTPLRSTATSGRPGVSISISTRGNYCRHVRLRRTPTSTKKADRSGFLFGRTRKSGDVDRRVMGFFVC